MLNIYLVKCFVSYSICICGSVLKRLYCKRYLNAHAKLQAHEHAENMNMLT